MAPPPSVEELKHAGNRAIAARSDVEAERLFRQLLVQDPESAPGYRGLAVSLERQDRHEDVVDLLRPVVDRLDSPSLWLKLGESLQVLVYRGRKDRVDEAIHAFERYSASVPEPAALYDRGVLLQKFKRDYQAAYECFLAAWHLFPRDQKAYTAGLACLRQLGRIEEAERLKAEWRAKDRT